jgi:hypothetical protein
MVSSIYDAISSTVYVIHPDVLDVDVCLATIQKSLIRTDWRCLPMYPRRSWPVLCRRLLIRRWNDGIEDFRALRGVGSLVAPGPPPGIASRRGR